MTVKKTKKLNVRKESLRRLDDRQLDRVAGGAPPTKVCNVDASGTCVSAATML